MLRLTVCMTISLALVHGSNICAGTTPKEPDYPLFAVSIERSYTEEELDKIAVWFDATHGALPADQVAYLKRRRPDFKVLAHINSTYTSGQDAPDVEAKLREAIAMYHTAILAEDIDASTAEFRLAPVSKGPIALKASTISGETSSAENGTREYVTWIQIDDEYLRIEEWDAQARRIRVRRGFSETEPAPHLAGAVVLSPVYIGVKRTAVWSGYYPGGAARYLRYALRNDHQAMYDYKVAEIISQIKAGSSDGPWLDIMGMGFFNQANTYGQHVLPWNFETGKTYTRQEYRDDIQRKAQYFRERIEEAVGRRVTMVANNLSGKYFPEDGHGKLYLVPTDIKPDPLDGLVLEGFAGEFLVNHFRTGQSMIGNIQIVMDMEKNRLGGYLSYDNCASRRAKTPEEARQKELHERYAYACFLLGVEPAGTVRFGIAAYRRASRENPRRHLWLHPQYFYGIGKPLETVGYQDLHKYQLPDHVTYCRQFENAFVFVNLSAQVSETLRLEQIGKVGRPLVDPETAKRVPEMQIGPHTGIILLKRSVTR